MGGSGGSTYERLDTLEWGVGDVVGSVEGDGAPAARACSDLLWYILVTSPMAEQAVARRLKRRLGGEHDPDYGDVLCDRVATFVAVARWTQKFNGKPVRRERIVLPRYLFAGFDGTPDWLALREVSGLHGVLARDGEAARVPAELVGELISRCASGCYRPPPEPMVQRGMRVVARSGRVRGLEGDVVDIDRRHGLADVAIDLFEGASTLRLRLDDLVSVAYADLRMTGS